MSSEQIARRKVQQIMVACYKILRLTCQGQVEIGLVIRIPAQTDHIWDVFDQDRERRQPSKKRLDELAREEGELPLNSRSK